MKKLYKPLTNPMVTHGRQRIMLLLILAFFSQSIWAQTINFNEITDAHDTNLGTVYTSGNFRFTMTDGSFFVSDQGNGATKGVRPVTSGAGAGTSLTIETIDGSEVQFESFYVNPSIIGYVDLTSIEGFKNGLSTGSNTAKITNPGKADMAAFLADVDKIILKSNMFLVAVFDDFVFSAASETANVAPLVTAPTAPTVTEDATDVAITDDIQLAEADLEDSHILTFTIMGGTLSLGESGITFGGNGNKSASFTAQGSVADLNTAMDAATFTPTPNLSGRGVASISFVANDGKEDSNTASVAFNINNVKDDPTFSSSAVTDLKEDKTYEYEITITDPDNDDLTVVATTKPDWLTLSGTAAGTATTLAGSGNRAIVNGQGTSASFDRVQVLDVSKSGVVYVIEGFTIRKIEPDGQVTTFAGTGNSGSQDGTGTMASFDGPSDLAVDTNGNIYLADLEDNSVRKITPDGVVTTLADGFLSRYLSVDGSGNVYVLDVSRNIWKVTASGVVSAVSNPKTYGSPTDLAADIEGNLYLAVNGTYVIKLTKSGSEVILAGSADAGNQNGIATDARFTGLSAIDVDETGMVYVAEKSVNHYQIRKITPQGVVTTVAGKAAIGAENGTVAAAGFNYPSGIGVDAQGNVYVPDENKNLIRKIAAASHTLTGNAAAEVGTHDVVLTVSDGNGGSVTQSFGIFVSDVVEFDATTSGGNESVSAADIPVSLSKRLITEASVDYAISGTAQNGSDYTLAAGTLLFAAGDLTKNITIGSIVDDTESETNETIILTLSNAVGIDLGNQKVHTYTINDNDPSTANAGADQNVCGSGTFLGGVPPNGNPGETSQWSIISGTGGSLRDANNPNTEFTGNHGTTYTLRWTITKGGGTSTDDVQITFLDNPTAAAAGVDQITRNSSVTLAANAASGFQESGTWSVVSGAGGSFSDANSPTATFQGVQGVTYTLRWTVGNGVCPVSSDDVLITILENNTPVFTSTPATSVNDNSSYRYYIHASDDDEDDLTITATTKPDWLTLSTLPAGTLSTIAGAQASGNNNGFATEARFKFPNDVAVDAEGNMYVADQSNSLIRKISPSGKVSTFAGSGRQDSNDGTGTAASFSGPARIAVDAAGNVYVADTFNNLIRKITKDGVVTTLASGIIQPYGIAVDAQGIVYVASILGNTIHKVSTSGQVSALAGSGSYGTKNGTGAEAEFSGPTGLALDAAGNVYVADWGSHLIRKITPAGVVTTWAGSGTQGSTDDFGTFASFNSPKGIAIDTEGIIYVTENTGSRIRKIEANRTVSTLQGTLSTAPNALSNPEGLTIDKAGNLIIADYNNNMIKLLPAQAQPVLSGSAVGQKGKHDVTLKADDGFGGVVEQSFSITVNDATAPVLTSATTASFAENGTGTAYTVVATDANAVTYSLGTGNDEALFDIAAGVVTFKSSPDFESPADANTDNAYIVNVVASDGSNTANQNVTITVTNVNETPAFTSTAVTSVNDNTGYNYTIKTSDPDGDALTVTATQKPDWLQLNSTPGGKVSTVAGRTDHGSLSDGPNGTFEGLRYLAVDTQGNVYVTNTTEHIVRKVAVDGTLSTIAGSYGLSGDVNGTGSETRLDSPADIAVDAAGNVYVSDRKNNKIKKITPEGVVTTFVGSGSITSSDGTGTEAGINRPFGLGIDAAGNLYIASDNAIRKATPEGVVTTLAGEFLTESHKDGVAAEALFGVLTELTVDREGNVYVLQGQVGQTRIRKLSKDGVVSTLNTQNQSESSYGLEVDNNGNVYFTNNYTVINKLNKGGEVTSFAGQVKSGSTDGDGTDPTTAMFTLISGITFDPNGDLLVADDGRRIRKITFPSFKLSGDATGLTGTYDVTLKADDGNGATVEQDFTVTVNDATDPVFTSATAVDFAENGTGAAYTVVATDANAVTYSLGTGNDEALFDIAAGVVTFKSSPDFESPADGDANNTYVINVISSDGVNSVNQDITITVTNVDDTDPVFTSASAVDFTENGTGTVYTVAATDANSLTYSLGTGNDEALFNISSGAVTFKTSPDFENPTDGDANNTYVINVIANDGINSVNQDVTITVTNVDDTDPVFTSATAVDFAENGTGTAYTATATDANALTYSLGSGNDEALFDIAGGVVTFKTSPDFENPGDANKDNAYVINVTVGDGVNSVGQLVTITVTNVNEAPSFISSAVTSVDDNATYNYAIAADDRDGDNLTITAVTKPDWLTLTSTSGNEVTTLAGSGSASSTNGTGTQASFNEPGGIAVDAAGNVYVAELLGHVIRKITPNGEVTTLAGSGSAGSANGTGTEASFNRPQGVAVDASGNVYVADFSNNLIRKITSEGVVTTFAGSGTAGSDNGPGTFASFNAPIGVAVDVANNVYVATFSGNLIRKISPAGVVSTLAGSGEYGNSNGNGTDATFFLPQNLAVDISGNVYVVGTQLVRKITPNGDVTTLAGSGAVGKVNANGTNASFASPSGVSVDASGNVFIADSGNNLIRKITPNGDVTTLAGSGSKGSTNADGLAASFDFPNAIAVDASGNVYVSDVYNHLIRKISTTSHLLTGDAAGQSGTHNVTLTSSDGNGGTAEQSFTITINDVTNPVFSSATAVDFAENGTGVAYAVSAADTNPVTYSLGSDNDEALFDIAAGVVTFKSSPDFENPVDGDANNTYVINVIASDGINPVNQDVTITVTNVDDTDPVFTSAKAVDFTENSAGTAYTITATDANTLTYSLGSGNDEALFDISAGIVTFKTSPDFECPADANTDNAYVINVIASDGINSANQDVTISVTNVNEAPEFLSDAVTSVDDNKDYGYNIRVSDQEGDNLTVTATIKPDWLNLTLDEPLSVSTIAGSGETDGQGTGVSKDGIGTDAAFGFPRSIVTDASGNIYMADLVAGAIRKIDQNAVVTTVAGNTTYEHKDGSGTNASFNGLNGIALGPQGNLYITSGSSIRKMTPEGVVNTLAGTSDGSTGYMDGTGSEALFSALSGITYDAVTNALYVTDIRNARIRKVTLDGVVTTFAGNGTVGNDNGTASAASFNSPHDIVVDSKGNFYVADAQSRRVRKITAGGMVSTFAGSSSGFKDGKGTAAQFDYFTGMTIDNEDILYVADAENNRIRRISPEGVVSTLLGGEQGYIDGDINVARLTRPQYLTVDADQNLILLGGALRLRRVNIDRGNQLKGSPVGQKGTFNVTLSLTDGTNDPVTQSFTVTVNDATKPVFTSTETAAFAENGTGAAYTALATDTNPVTYSLGTGNDESLFNIDGTSGAVTFKTSPDFENPADGDANNTYVINVIASDGINWVNQDVTITVTNVDDTDPIFTSGVAVDFAENGTGTAYTVIATDANTVTYSLGTGNDETLFDITAGAVTFKTAPDFENPTDGDANNTYVINVIASDGINSVNQDVTITVTNVDDTDPVFTSVTAVDFAENGTGTAYTVVATDANTVTYSLGMGNDESLFDIAAGAVTFKTAPDFENPTDGDANNTYVINVIASDGINSVNQDVTITVTNVDDTDPVFTSATTASFAENGTGTVYTVTATDANTLTYSLGTGNDESLFDIAAGVVTFMSSPDFENPADTDGNNIYVINVIASDGINIVNQDVSITVTNVDDTDPVFTSATAVDFAENGTGTAYTVVATDANALTYSLGIQKDETLFNMDQNSGVVTFKTAPDFENPVDSDANNTYVINVIASDGINSVNQDVTITVTDADEIAPSVSITSSTASFTSGVFTITVEYSEVVSGFAVGDISVTNGAAGNFTSVTEGRKWTADITPAADGTVTVNIAASSASDAAGNENTAATALSLVNDETVPGVTLSAGALTGDAYTVTAQFSESVSGFDLADVTISGGTGSDFTAVDGDTYTFSVSSANPLATVDIAAGVSTDAAGNENTVSNQLSLVFNSSPSDIALSNTSIDENNETGATIGNFSTTDTDASDSHTYSVVSGDGDTDNASFTIEGTSLKAAEVFDFETKSSYSVRIKTDDGRGGSFEKAFTISIDNVAEPEVIVSGTVDFPETQLGITVSTMITISNIGEAPVEVIASSAPADFSVTPGSVILMAGESRQVNVNFTPTQEATYSGNLVFTYNGLQVTLPVSGIGAIVTGIDDEWIDENEIRLYPNPASDIVNIDLSQVHAPALDIALVNASGKAVNGWKDYRQKQLSIRVIDLDNGLYIMQFTDGKSVVRKKVIIRK